jgi:hypothetical protein
MDKLRISIADTITMVIKEDDKYQESAVFYSNIGLDLVSIMYSSLELRKMSKDNFLLLIGVKG